MLSYVLRILVSAALDLPEKWQGNGWMDRRMEKQAICFQRQFYKGMEGKHTKLEKVPRSLGKGEIGVNGDCHIICVNFL